MHLGALKVLPCWQNNVKESSGGGRVSFVSMEETQQTTIRLCLLQRLIPSIVITSLLFKGSGGKLYFPQKVGSYLQQTRKDHPKHWIWTDFWIQSLITQFEFPMEWICEKKYTLDICCEECWAYKEDWFIHHPWSRRRSRQKGNIESWKHIWWQWQGHTGCISFSFSLDERLRQVDYLGNSHFWHAMHKFV